MPIMAGIIILLQLTVVYHAFRYRRPYYWIFVIMAFPVLGALVYFLVEVLPGSRSERDLKKIGNDIAKAINPDRAVKRRRLKEKGLHLAVQPFWHSNSDRLWVD
jgi:hypothetical protein